MTDAMQTAGDTEIFDRVESQVRSYSRSFPRLFTKARNAKIHGADGTEYIDFLAGCSSLNYGHNDPDMKSALIDHITSDGLTQGLDLFTNAKRDFLAAYENIILRPRNMNYRMQFTGPTGANAVEAAMKLARKVTGRQFIVSFTNGYHGVSLGALAATGNSGHRGAAGVTLSGIHRAAYDGYFGPDVDTAEMLDTQLSDPGSGIDAPAAIIVEAVQGEGGLKAASADWLRKVQAIARKHGALLIIDDIQAGCGRTGTFFSFEEIGLDPDIITHAKSISGMGLPMAAILIRPEHDIWKPAEHNGTFRGNNHAFVTARVALEKFWKNDRFEKAVKEKGDHLASRLEKIAQNHGLSARGRGMMRGVNAGSGERAEAICKECFKHDLIIETSGPHDEIVKVLCPLTIEKEVLDAGLDVMENAFATVFGQSHLAAAE
ncbi:diaminobutyrate--2-oxoglutarate transaminase [Pararhizobium mangrovi]|uniref:Diaminobutyrate--2-oxoglutarate transaminase n=1 Tax=Pararhizobium mangrovi TaxID=2590452 RepID=A0A506UE68_9HYPH|nr:diaminobutyrate--2-oxoglutarate transaminase [Pararhizobium mangrovi]TPW31254.1 diaminobutyrate--2-oxoglutarate transaminase [Pararhizobium mangrovi]